MKIEALLLGHALLSGVGAAGSVAAIRFTGVELLYVPLSVCVFLMLSDLRNVTRHRRAQKSLR
jgi:hypothetical protein